MAHTVALIATYDNGRYDRGDFAAEVTYTCEPSCVEAQMRNAIRTFVASPQGQLMVQSNNGDFNWGDALEMSDVDWHPFGIESVQIIDSVGCSTIIVDHDERFVGNDNDDTTTSEDQELPLFTVPWVHTGKFEATYIVPAKSQEEADTYVAEHRLELEPKEVFPLSDDYQQYL